MTQVNMLAALVILLRPDLEPGVARQLAQHALDRVSLPSDAPKPRKPRVGPDALRDRVVTALRSLSFAPSRRELYPHVRGNRPKVMALIKSMIEDGTLLIHRNHQQISLLLADGTSMSSGKALK